MTPELEPLIMLKQHRDNIQLEIQVAFKAALAAEKLIGNKDLKVNVKVNDAKNSTSTSYSIPVFFFNYQPPKFTELQ